MGFMASVPFYKLYLLPSIAPVFHTQLSCFVTVGEPRDCRPGTLDRDHQDTGRGGVWQPTTMSDSDRNSPGKEEDKTSEVLHCAHTMPSVYLD